MKYSRIISYVSKYAFYKEFEELRGQCPSELYEVSIKPIKPSRNTLQNKHYWAIVDNITKFENKANERGWTKDDTHRYLKSEYFVKPDQMEEIVRELWDGKVSTQEFLMKLLKVTEEITTTDKEEAEFSRIVERIIKDYEQIGLIIENPNNPPLSSYDNPKYQ